MTACSGGSGSLQPVTGTVQVNGKPAIGAQISFHPEGQTGVNVVSSTGVVGEDGTFKLDTMGKPGAPVGKYIVTIVWPEAPKGAGGKPLPPGTIGTMGSTSEPKDQLAGKYAKKEGSTLKAEIKSGENKLEPFNLN